MQTPQLDAAHHAHLQGLLQQLQARMASVVHAAPPLASPTEAVALPPADSWRTTSAQLRAMRVAATQLFATVLTQEEKERAREWGWEPSNEQNQLAATAAIAAAPSAPVAAAATAGEEEASGPSTAVVPLPTLSPSVQFHRFNVPLSSLVDEFSAATRGVRQILAYHSALMTAVQNQARGAQSHPPTAPPSLTLNSLSRFLFVLKQRVELQKQAAQVQSHFSRALLALQQELQQREQREQLHRLSSLTYPTSDAAPIPLCDLFALAASLGVLRSELKLVNSTDDPAAAYAVLQPGEMDFCSDKTSDGREVSSIEDSRIEGEEDGLSPTPRISCASLSCEKHVVNLSSTGTTTCFVHDVVFIKPLLRTAADREALMQVRAQVAALPRGLASLHPQSSLAQLLRHGFCLHGTLETLAETERSSFLDQDGLDALFARNLPSYRRKLSFMVEAERLSAAHPDEKLWTRAETVGDVMQQQTQTAKVSSTPGLLSRMSVRSKIEGPALVFRDSLPRHSPPVLSMAVPTEREFEITFVGMEKIYDFASVSAPSLGADAMDTSAEDSTATVAAAVPSGALSAAASAPLKPSFAFRFVMSHPLLMPLSTARRIFPWSFGSGADAEKREPAGVGKPAPAVADGSYFQSFRGLPAAQLQSDDARDVQCTVLGRRQVYEPIRHGWELREPVVLIDSFLCHSLEQFAPLPQQCRTLFLLQRLYRSIISAPVSLPASLRSAAQSSAQPVETEGAAAATSPASSVAVGRTTKLKFSHRQMMGLPNRRAPFASAPASTAASSTVAAPAAVPRIEFGTSVDAAAGSSFTMTLRTSRPRLELQISVADSMTAEPTIAMTNEGGAVPSPAFAEQVLRSTASVPILMHALASRSPPVLDLTRYGIEPNPRR